MPQHWMSSPNWGRHNAVSRVKFSPLKSLLTQLLTFSINTSLNAYELKSHERVFPSFFFSFCKYNGGARWQTVRELFLEHGRVHDAHFVTHAAVCCFNLLEYWLHSKRRRNYQVPSPKRAQQSRAMIGANGELSRQPNLTIETANKARHFGYVLTRIGFLCTQGSRILAWEVVSERKNWFACYSTQWPTEILIYTDFLWSRVWHSRMNSPAICWSLSSPKNQFPAFLRHQSPMFTPAKQLRHKTPDPWLNHKPSTLTISTHRVKVFWLIPEAPLALFSLRFHRFRLFEAQTRTFSTESSLNKHGAGNVPAELHGWESLEHSMHIKFN